MSSPAAVALRTELDAALAVLGPQINGFTDLLAISLSEPTHSAVQAEQTDHERRRDLCNAVLASLDALEADHYPDMPKHDLVASSLSELQEQSANIAAALAEFEAAPVASAINVALGSPSAKT